MPKTAALCPKASAFAVFIARSASVPCHKGPQQRYRVHAALLCPMRYLDLARAALCRDDVGVRCIDRPEQVCPDLHRYVVFFLLESVRAGYAAAAGVRIQDLGCIHFLQEFQPRHPYAESPQMAGSMVDYLFGGAMLSCRQRQFSGFDAGHEEFLGIEQMPALVFKIREKRRDLGFEHEFAARAHGQHRDAFLPVSCHDGMIAQLGQYRVLD